MTDIPTIDPLPAPPQRGQDPAVFVQRADTFIDALTAFVDDLNLFGAQLVLATQERVVNEAAESYDGALAARDAAIAARNAAQGFAASIDPANLVHRTGDESVDGTKNFTGILQLAGRALTLAATYAEASTADIRANVAERLVSVRAMWNALVPVGLADASTIALDLNTGIHFTVTLGGNRTLAAPTNEKPGQEGFIRVVQDGTGGRSLSFAAAYKLPDLATAPSLNTGAGQVTLIRYHVSSAGEVFLSGGKLSPARRVATLVSSESAKDYFYAQTAMTLKWTLRNEFGSAATSISRSTGAAPDSFQDVASGSFSTGATGTFTIEAGAYVRFFISNGAGGYAWLTLEQQ
jgi:hypothetical protein